MDIQPINLDLSNYHENQCSYDYLSEFLHALSLIQRRVYVLTADYPPRLLMDSAGNLNIPNLIYMNVGIREQHLCAMAHGLHIVDKSAVIILLCGDAFMYRCADQVNVMAQSRDNIIIYNVQAGLSGAQNGSTHQSSGQPGAFITMPGIAVYEPSSKADWIYCMNRALVDPGPKYIRTHKGYSLNSTQQGPFYIVHHNDDINRDKSLSQPSTFGDIMDLYKVFKDTICLVDYIIITSGMIVANAVKARKLLEEKGYIGAIINIVAPKNIKGISKIVPSSVPIFFFYNGNVEILSSIVCRQLYIEKVSPGNIYEQGFNLGATGSIPDIMDYFAFTPEKITSFIESHL
jgi:transketolase C-terminal domain/subunit